MGSIADPYSFQAPQWADLTSTEPIPMSPSTKDWFENRAISSCSPQAVKPSPVSVPTVVNSVPVAVPRSWTESQRCTSENEPPPVIVVSPPKSTFHIKETKTPITRSRAAASGTTTVQTQGAVVVKGAAPGPVMIDPSLVANARKQAKSGIEKTAAQQDARTEKKLSPREIADTPRIETRERELSESGPGIVNSEESTTASRSSGGKKSFPSDTTQKEGQFVTQLCQGEVACAQQSITFSSSEGNEVGTIVDEYMTVAETKRVVSAKVSHVEKQPGSLSKQTRSTPILGTRPELKTTKGKSADGQIKSIVGGTGTFDTTASASAILKAANAAGLPKARTLASASADNPNANVPSNKASVVMGDRGSCGLSRAVRVPAGSGKQTNASQALTCESVVAKGPASEPTVAAPVNRTLNLPAAARKATVASQGWQASQATVSDAPTVSKQTIPAGPPRLMTSSRRDRAAPPVSSEEMELLRATREIQENQKLRSQWRSHLEKVLANPGRVAPVRSTTKLTMPKEFHFHESSRSAPTSPRCPRNNTLAEQVRDFTKTPRRFRSKGANDPATPLCKTRITVTESKSMSLLTDSRARTRRTPSVKSAAQLEEEALASLPKFKARPVNRKVLASSGDLGVPRVQRPPPTEPKEFHLSSGNYSARNKEHDDEKHSTCSAPAYTFKARPANRAIFEHPVGIAQVTPRHVTRPVSPKLATSMRASSRPTASSTDSADEEFKAFRARGVPAAVYSPRLVEPQPQPVTSPRPFKLQSELRHELAKDSFARQLQEIAEREKKERDFKAKPMPVMEAWTPRLESHITETAPFQLSTDQRGYVYCERLASQRAEAECTAARGREFHARPASVVTASPFVTHKSDKPLTEIKAFNINTDVRSEKRKALEEEHARRRAEKEVHAAKAAALKQLEEAAALAELRKQMVHKARPASVLKATPFQPQRAHMKSTKPESPCLATKIRGSLRAGVI